jgi:hypothetical protein
MVLLFVVAREPGGQRHSPTPARGTSPGVPPGTYFVMVSVVYNNQPLFWNVKVDLKPTVSLTVSDRGNGVWKSNR